MIIQNPILRATRYTVMRSDEPIFSEHATHVEIEDDGGGEYIKIIQSFEKEDNMVKIDPDEWKAIKSAIEKLIVEIKTLERKNE